jgi:hypothetical protein
MTETQPEPLGRVDAIERAICQERCAYLGEPPCWRVEPLQWPNPNCAEPSCRAFAVAAEITVRRLEGGP